MPEFSTPFTGNNCEKKISKDELIRTIRFSIASEFEAIQLYEQIIQATSDEFVKTVIQDITNEEKVHVGEFLKILKVLSPKEFDFYDEGKKEVEDEFEQ